jgi:hypothetical protein
LSRQFYLQALALIGYSPLTEVSAAETGRGDAAGFGVAPKPDFWIDCGSANVPPVHVAFRAGVEMIETVGGVKVQPKHRLSCHCGAVVLALDLPEGIVNPRR